MDDADYWEHMSLDLRIALDEVRKPEYPTSDSVNWMESAIGEAKQAIDRFRQVRGWIG